MTTNRKRGFYLVLGLSMIPAILLFFLEPFSESFESKTATFNTIGKLAGLIGMSLFALNFVFASRWKFLEKIIGPLDQQYYSHHMTGGAALIFLLFHPIFLALQFSPIGWQYASSFLLDYSDPWIMLGRLALFLLIGLLVITFYGRWKYENWKLSHKWLGLPLFLGGVHAFMVPSDISEHMSLKAVMASYIVLGMWALFWRTILKMYKNAEYIFTVEAINKISDKITEVVLKPVGVMPHFMPGQFAFVNFQSDGLVGETHPFSISSGPEEDRLRFSIKSLGDFTEKMSKITPGTSVRVEGPFGGFTYLDTQIKRQIWIAGGIGITPFLAMSRHIQRNGIKDYKIDLFYSLVDRNDNAFVGELESLSNSVSDFKFHPHYVSESGYLTSDKFLSGMDDIGSVEIFLCGPPSFMDSLREQLSARGVSHRHIHFEVFALQ